MLPGNALRLLAAAVGVGLAATGCGNSRDPELAFMGAGDYPEGGPSSGLEGGPPTILPRVDAGACEDDAGADAPLDAQVRGDAASIPGR